MGNIPLPRQSDVKEAAGYSQVDPSTGTAPFKSMVGLGGAIVETGKTFAMFAGKKKKAMNDKAKADQEISYVTRQGEIDKFAAENQDDPKAIKKFATDTMAASWDDVDRSEIDEETENELRLKYQLNLAKSNVSVTNKVTQIEVNNANASILQAADTVFRSGDYQAGLDYVNQTSLSQDKKIEVAQKKFQNAKDGEAVGAYNDAKSIEDVESFIETLNAKNTKAIVEGKDGKESEVDVYDNYEVMIKGRAMGGISIERRQQLNSWAESKLAKLNRAKTRDVNKALNAIARNEDYVAYETDDFTNEDIERLDSLHQNRNIGKDAMSDEYTDLLEDLTDMKGEIGTFWSGLRGEKVQPIEKLDKIREQVFAEGAFNAKAKIGLWTVINDIEAEMATQDEVEYDKTSTHNGEDYELSDAESAVWTSASQTVDSLVKSLYKKPRVGMSMAGVGTAMVNIREEIFTRYQNGEFNEETSSAFIKNVLPEIITKHISEPTSRDLDNTYQF